MKIFIILCIYFALLKYFLSVLSPFLFAVIIFFLLKPLIELLERIIHFRKTAIGISLLLMIYMFMVIMIIYLLFYCISYCLSHFQYYVSFYTGSVEPFIAVFFKNYPFLYNYFYNLLQEGIYLMATMMSSIPSILFSLFLMSISSFYFILDYNDIKKYLIDHFSKKIISSFIKMKDSCLKSIYVYIYTQGILMTICFFVLLCVFSLLDIKHFLIFAFLLSLLDALPFIGVGIGMIPLSVYYFMNHLYMNCIYIFIVFLFLNVLRNILESYLMNKQLKIPSFILLLSMMIHLYVFGFLGFFLSIVHMNIIFGYLQYRNDI